MTDIITVSKQKKVAKPKLTREKKAHQIYNQGLVRTEFGLFNYKVRSQFNENMEYDVFHDGKAKFCSCTDHANTNRECKHIMAVELVKYGIIRKEEVEA